MHEHQKVLKDKVQLNNLSCLMQSLNLFQLQKTSIKKACEQCHLMLHLPEENYPMFTDH